jgi:hypothetical protein
MTEVISSRRMPEMALAGGRGAMECSFGATFGHWRQDYSGGSVLM